MTGSRVLRQIPRLRKSLHCAEGFFALFGADLGEKFKNGDRRDYEMFLQVGINRVSLKAPAKYRRTFVSK
ncbi:MAG TPA: hypothetical protein VGR71_14380 [Nitrospira sp.]|nr:hypothetical protein [Nitrospira sp.]